MKQRMLDTHVILRYILRDHDQLSPQARDLFVNAAKGEIELLLDPVVIAECCAVLSGKIYGYAKRDVAGVLGQIVMMEGVFAADPVILSEALEFYAKHNLDFTDAYLATTARGKGVTVVDFDHDFSRKHPDASVNV
ncbi:PIN domain-containing protein [Alicyclobacillus fodiniaquatilis]|uniref:Ribonuclease VapC n=1 Tax=Alicyclobacillus fodiniaquatilis TaxID=1661150 RepID=A0ABW4JLT1_9BACL